MIVGAGVYGVVAYEIAIAMQCFNKIGFVDDEKEVDSNGMRGIGKIKDIETLNGQYNHIIVAIGDSKTRLSLLKRIEEETSYTIATLLSPKAYVAPSAQIKMGSIIEPMAVIHSLSVISIGCIISAGAIVNHASVCGDGVHVDCNVVVKGNTVVPTGTKIQSGAIYGNNKKNETTFPHTPTPIDGKTYNFDDVM